MRILVATDAWHPQVNGVVRTLATTAKAAKALDADVTFLTPEHFRTMALPTYRDLRLALPRARHVARLIAAAQPDAIHIATEGPIGHAVRRYCMRRGLPFTTSFHTRFPEYVSARLPMPERWTEGWVWAWLRRFHRHSRAVMAATPALARELRARGFSRVVLWPRGVDADLFHPQAADLGLPRPVFLSVGRVAVEKNLEAFLGLDLPGTKVVVGDGPARAALEKAYPDTVFLGALHGAALARAYAAADVFVFPSRTDTFGLVMLEALASGVPVAAFPVSGPRDVIGDAKIENIKIENTRIGNTKSEDIRAEGGKVGVLDGDLRKACVAALDLSREDCRAFALRHSWDSAARAFVGNIAGTPRMGESDDLSRVVTAARLVG